MKNLKKGRWYWELGGGGVDGAGEKYWGFECTVNTTMCCSNMSR